VTAAKKTAAELIEQSMRSSKRLRDLERLTDYFFIARKEVGNLSLEVPTVIKTTQESFNKNLQALYWATYIPWMLTYYGAYQKAFERHLQAQRIRSLDPADITKKMHDPEYGKSEAYAKKLKEGNARALLLAREEFSRNHLTPEGVQLMQEQAIEELVSLLDFDVICTASQELLRQSIVLLWVALEALATDLFVIALNDAPQMTVELLKDDHCRKRFQSRDFARIVEQHGFDLSGKMGDVLKSLGNLDDPETIKAVFNVLCPSAGVLRETLARPELWKLYQRRNLLVHRAGMIDKAFLEKTGERLEVGTKLPVTSGDVDNFVEFVAGVGKELIAAVAETMKHEGRNL